MIIAAVSVRILHHFQTYAGPPECRCIESTPLATDTEGIGNSAGACVADEPLGRVTRDSSTTSSFDQEGPLTVPGHALRAGRQSGQILFPHTVPREVNCLFTMVV